MQAEAETLRQELSSLVTEIREYALALEECDNPELDNVAQALFAIVRGDPR